jgi:hypothetical protein
MRAYLLGALDGPRTTQLDERLRREPEIYEELLAAEEELIDEYHAGNLSELEQHQFETYFAITVERQKNVRFGSLLKRYNDSHADDRKVVVDQAPKTAPAKKRFPFFLPGMNQPALAYGAAVAAVVIVLCFWVATRNPAEQQAVEQSDSPTIAVTLKPGSTRSAGATPRVAVPPQGRFQVKLDLELANAGFNNYKSQLFKESKSLLTSGELKREARGAQQVVPVVIAGEILTPGDYELKLTGILDSGADEFIDKYSFRVIAE